MKTSPHQFTNTQQKHDWIIWLVILSHRVKASVNFKIIICTVIFAVELLLRGNTSCIPHKLNFVILQKQFLLVITLHLVRYNYNYNYICSTMVKDDEDDCAPPVVLLWALLIDICDGFYLLSLLSIDSIWFDSILFVTIRFVSICLLLLFIILTMDIV
jgi:hypothetical protein